MTSSPVPQRAVIVVPTTAEFDSRTYRIATSLAARGHQVTVLARSGPGLPPVERRPEGYAVVRVRVSAVDGLPLPGLARAWLGRRLARRSGRAGQAPEPASQPSRDPVGRLRRAVLATWRIAAIALTVRAQSRASRAVDPGADLYHGMAYMGIPIALDLARRRGARVVYDARDIYVDANNLARLPSVARAVLRRIERGWARRVDRVITVNRPYAEVMASRWNAPKPAIIMNCAYRFEPPVAREHLFHDRLGLPSDVRVVLYQGGFAPSRGIEQLLDTITLVPRAVLVLMGYGPLADRLAARVSEPDLTGRAFVLPAVPPAELIGYVAAADVVAMPIQPSTLNHRLTTPNKLFEALAAGVPVVAADLPGMAGIVRETGCGLLVDPGDIDAIANAIRHILDLPTEQRDALRHRELQAAHERYSWEVQAEILLAEYGRLTGRPW